MKAEFRSLLVALALFGLACSPPMSPDGGVIDGGGSDSCEDDDQCPPLFRCSRSSATCVPDCNSAAQCAPSGRAAVGAGALDFCPTETSCVCDYTEAGGECKAKLCSSDAECGSLVCRSGKCEAAPTTAMVTRCAVIPDFAVVKAGSKVKFWASAWNGTNPVVVKEGATWAAAAGGALSAPTPATGAASELTVSMTATTSGDGVAGVEATFGTTKCTGKVIIVPATAANAVVVVTDELSGRPVAGAKVVLSAVDGQPIGQPVDTGATGVASIPHLGAITYSVSVFHPEFSYLTIANYRPSTGADAHVISAVVRRNSVSKYGGFKGTFDGYPMDANIKAGVASMSLAGAITSLNLTSLLGPSRKARIKVGPIDSEVAVPDGAFIVVNETNKNQIAGLGQNGTCNDSAGAPDETKIRAGGCGTRAAWGFSGAVRIADITPLITAFMGGTLSINSALGQLAPLIRQLNSSIVRDVQFNLRDAVCKMGSTAPNCTTGYDYTDLGGFTDRNMKFADVPLAFGFVLKSPKLPSYRGKAVDGAVGLTGVSVPGRGVIPLGIGAAANVMPADDVLDKQSAYPADGLLPIRTAPSHSGTEGAEYGIIVAALSASAASDASAQIGASALYVRLPDNKLPFDPRGTMPLDISNTAYPIMPESARFNAHTAPVLGIPARSFRFVTPATATTLSTSVQVLRVTFSDELEYRWDVLVDATRASEGFSLPIAPAGTRDRLFRSGMAASPRSPMLVQALRLSATPQVAGQPAAAPLSFTSLVELNATNYDHLTNYLTAFSFLDFGTQAVSFKTDLAVAVPDGGKIVVKVDKFKVGTAAGDEGLVKLSFETAAGAPVANCDTQSSSTEVTAGKGEVEFTVPAACTANAVTVKAQLFYDATTPVLPEISTVKTNVTIQ